MTYFNKARNKSSTFKANKNEFRLGNYMQLQLAEVNKTKNNQLKQFATQLIRKTQNKIGRTRKSQVNIEEYPKSLQNTVRRSSVLQNESETKQQNLLQTMGNLAKQTIKSADKIMNLLDCSSFQFKVAYKLYCSDRDTFLTFLQQLVTSNQMGQKSCENQNNQAFHRKQILSRLSAQSQNKNQFKDQSHVKQHFSHDFFRLLETPNYNYLSQVTRLSRFLKTIFNDQLIEQYIEGVGQEAKIKQLIDIKLGGQSKKQIGDWQFALMISQKKLNSLQKQLIQKVKQQVDSNEKSDQLFIQMQKIRQLVKQTIYPKISQMMNIQFNEFSLSQIISSYVYLINGNRQINNQNEQKMTNYSTKNQSGLSLQKRLKLADLQSQVCLLRQENLILKMNNSIKKQHKMNRFNSLSTNFDKNHKFQGKNEAALSSTKKVKELEQKTKILRSKNQKLQKEYEFYQNKINSLEELIQMIKQETNQQINKYKKIIKKLQNQIELTRRINQNPIAINKKIYEKKPLIFPSEMKDKSFQKIDQQIFTKISEYQQKLALSQQTYKRSEIQLKNLLEKKYEIISILQKQNHQLSIENKVLEQKVQSKQENDQYEKLINKQKTKLQIQYHQLLKEKEIKIKQLGNKISSLIIDKQKTMLEQTKQYYDSLKAKDLQISSLEVQIKQYFFQELQNKENQSKIRMLECQVMQNNKLIDSANEVIESLHSTLRIERDEQKYLENVTKEQSVWIELQKKLRDQNLKHTQENSDLSQKLKELSLKQGEALKNINLLKLQIQKYQEQLTELDFTKKKLQQDIYSKDSQINRLQSLILFNQSTLEIYKDNQVQQKQKLEMTLSQANQRYAKLFDQYELFRLNMKQQKQQLDSVLLFKDSHITQLEQQLSKKFVQVKCKGEKEKIKQKNLNQEIYLQQIQLLQKQLSQNNILSGELSSEIKRQRQEYQCLENKKNELELEGLQLCKQNDKQQLQINSLKQQILNIQQSNNIIIREKNMKIKSLEKELMKFSEKDDNEKNNLSFCLQSSLQYGLNSSKLDPRQSQKHKQIIMRQDHQEFTKELNTLQNKNSQLKSIILRKDIQLKELGQKIQKEKNSRVQESKNKESQNMIKKQEIKKMKIQLERSLDFIEKIQQDNRKMKEQLQKQAHTYKNEAFMKQRLIQNLKKEIQTQKNNLEQKIKDKNHVINRLQQQIFNFKHNSERKLQLNNQQQPNKKQNVKNSDVLMKQLAEKEKMIVELKNKLAQREQNQEITRCETQKLKFQLITKQKQAEYMKAVFFGEDKRKLIKSAHQPFKPTSDLVQMDQSILLEPKKSFSCNSMMVQEDLNESSNLNLENANNQQQARIQQLQEEFQSKEQLFESVVLQKNKIIEELKIKQQKIVQQKEVIIRRLKNKIADMELEGTNVPSGTDQSRIKELKRFKTTLNDIMLQTQKKLKKFQEQIEQKNYFISQMTQLTTEISIKIGIQSCKKSETLLATLKTIKEYLQKMNSKKQLDYLEPNGKGQLSYNKKLEFEQEETPQIMIQSQYFEMGNLDRSLFGKSQKEQYKEKIFNFMNEISQKKQIEIRKKVEQSQRRKINSLSKIVSQDLPQQMPKTIGNLAVQYQNPKQNQDLNASSPFSKAKQSYLSIYSFEQQQSQINHLTPLKPQYKSNRSQRIQLSPISVGGSLAFQTIHEEKGEWVEPISGANSNNGSLSINSDDVEDDFKPQQLHRLSCKQFFKENLNQVGKNAEILPTKLVFNEDDISSPKKKKGKDWNIVIRNCQDNNQVGAYHYENNSSKQLK